MFPNFYRNDGNKNVISADLENVSEGHHLQKSLYLGNYTAYCNKTFTKMMTLRLTTKTSHQQTLKI